MYWVLHEIIVALYIVVPVAAGIVCFWASGIFRARFVASIFLGVAIAVVLNFASAFLQAGYVKVPQFFLTAYLACALLLILKGFDLLLCNGLAHLLVGRRARAGWVARQIAFVLRMVILVVICLPYILAAGLTYRPKIAASQTPRSVLGANYSEVSFTTTDGVRINGWWIPAERPRAFYANRTVLLCPGYGSDKSTALNLVRQIVPECFNVLVIDFRGCGESGGQLCSFGDLERRDVLAAVHWVLVNHASEAKKIEGIGESTGAAALIAAAADGSREGQAISAIVAYTPFARLMDLSEEMAKEIVIEPAAGPLVHVALPMASAQTGTDLSHFAPADLVSRFWPRPILIVHSQGDEVVPWEEGDALYHAATFPKDYYWLDNKNHRQTMSDENAGKYVLRFLQTARSVPVI